MIKKTVTYKDYNDVERTEEFFFNLTEAEITEMEMSVEGGLVEKINRIVVSKAGDEIIKLFKDIILKAYGQKSPDGRTFIKTEEVKQNFLFSPAYSIIYMELATDADKAAKFIEQIVPKPRNNPSN